MYVCTILLITDRVILTGREQILEAQMIMTGLKVKVCRTYNLSSWSELVIERANAE